MLWVLKITVSLRRFFEHPKHILKTDRYENFLNFMDKMFDIRYPENGTKAWYRELMAQDDLDVDNLRHKNK